MLFSLYRIDSLRYNQVSKKLFKATVGDRRIHEDKISDHITAYSNGHAVLADVGRKIRS